MTATSFLELEARSCAHQSEPAETMVSAINHDGRGAIPHRLYGVDVPHRETSEALVVVDTHDAVADLNFVPVDIEAALTLVVAGCLRAVDALSCSGLVLLAHRLRPPTPCEESMGRDLTRQ